MDTAMINAVIITNLEGFPLGLTGGFTVPAGRTTILGLLSMLCLFGFILTALEDESLFFVF